MAGTAFCTAPQVEGLEYSPNFVFPLTTGQAIGRT
jgi:hypothetical protein